MRRWSPCGRLVSFKSRRTWLPNLIKTALPHAVHVAHPSRRLPANSKQKDPLFWLNVTCAKLRADLARLSRRTWSASKKPECLQDALDLYIAYSNGYPAW